MLCDKFHEFTKNAHKPRVNLGGGDRISDIRSTPWSSSIMLTICAIVALGYQLPSHASYSAPTRAASAKMMGGSPLAAPKGRLAAWAAWVIGRRMRLTAAKQDVPPIASPNAPTC